MLRGKVIPVLSLVGFGVHLIAYCHSALKTPGFICCKPLNQLGKRLFLILIKLLFPIKSNHPI